jgi:ABC-type dipeptide/oligopeptide/nickel transport system permease component
MLWFAAKRIAAALPTIFIATSLIFFIARILPGDPAAAILGDSATEQALVALRERLGIDQPLWIQYADYVEQVFRLDLGRSMISGRPVLQEVVAVFPYTLELTTFAIAFGMLVGVPVGVVAALRRNEAVDYVSRLGSLVGLSFPPFFLGICLLLLFAIVIPIFPVVGTPRGYGWGERLWMLVLPGCTLGIIFLSFVARATRSAMLEVLPEQYIRTAESKGIPERAVILRHACRNALLPIITVGGLYFGILMGNSVVTEIVFSRPGLGKLIVGALSSRDYVMLQGLTLIYCIIVIFVNLVTDIICGLADPRVKQR